MKNSDSEKWQQMWMELAQLFKLLLPFNQHMSLIKKIFLATTATTFMSTANDV